MIKSMTAFASHEVKIDELTINCELRSVNHRYCDITVKLPELLRFSEFDIRTAIALQLKRGKIECSLKYKKQVSDGRNMTVNEQAVKALLHATNEIEQYMHVQHSFSALEVLNFPGILQEPKINESTLLMEIIHLIKNTLEQMIVAREREGQQLALLIEERCKKIQFLIVLASKRLPSVLQQIRVKMKRRFSELVADPDFDRLEQEMLFLTQKLDVAEELDRLDTHVNEMLNLLNKNEPVGRHLDFLTQEMNRETNTLGSKSADKEMTQISIDLKVLIEQIREQTQNIE